MFEMPCIGSSLLVTIEKIPWSCEIKFLAGQAVVVKEIVMSLWCDVIMTVISMTSD